MTRTTLPNTGPTLTCAIDARGNAVVLTFKGSMGTDDLPTLEALIEAVTRLRPRFLIADLAGVRFITSLGIRGLLRLHKATQDRGGRTSLVAPSPFVAEVLRVVGLHTVLPVYPTVEAACEAVRERAPGA